MIEHFPPCVQRGGKYLDRVRPGWFKQIDKAVLNVGSCILCVLGQLFGEFTEALRQFPETRGLHIVDCFPFAESHGFCISRNPDRDYNLLTKLWILEINARLANAK